MSWQFFLTTLKVGLFSFGGGYAMISLLQYELVSRMGFLSNEEFASGVALGQATPGPVMIMIAFMGYRIAGLAGAVVGTIGLVIPMFLVVLVLTRLYGGFSNSPMLEKLMKGVNLAVVGVLAGAVFTLGKASILDVPTTLIALASFVFTGPLKKDPVWVVVASAIAGVLLYRPS